MELASPQSETAVCIHTPQDEAGFVSMQDELLSTEIREICISRLRLPVIASCNEGGREKKADETGASQTAFRHILVRVSVDFIRILVVLIVHDTIISHTTTYAQHNHAINAFYVTTRVVM